MIPPSLTRRPAPLLPALLMQAIFAVSCPATAKDADPSLAALSCLGCHTGDEDGSELYALDRIGARMIAAELRAYRAGTRQGTVMNRIAGGLDDGEIEGIARFLGEPQ